MPDQDSNLDSTDSESDVLASYTIGQLGVGLGVQVKCECEKGVGVGLGVQVKCGCGFGIANLVFFGI